MDFEKINDSLFIDLNIISVLFIKSNKVFHEDIKEMKLSFQVFGITSSGFEIPMPLLEVDSYAEAEDWILAYFPLERIAKEKKV